MLDASGANAAALVLAAGAATRMGRIKQLLPYGSGTLLTHAISGAVEAGFRPVIVVLGAGAEAIRPAIESLAIEIAVNPDWETGMGSSIRTGLQRLLERDKSPEYLAILLADQPHVHAAHLAEMHGLLTRSDASLIAAEYEGTLGVPAIFRRDLYPALAALPTQAGARQLLREHEAELLRYPLPAAAIDIDTPSDFAALEPE